jgi:methyltransferase (TIGR00027 family)
LQCIHWLGALHAQVDTRRNMANTKVSRSAEGVAGMRAIEMHKPEADRIVSDSYARALVPGGIMFTMSMWIIESGLYERMAPGAIGFIIGRERYIDDYLKARLSESLDQVVILGAGFDTRAYRIPGIERTRVFEIDQGATQSVKLERLKKVIDPLPAHVTFVPADLNTQQLGDVLESSGYNKQGKTLFIWQGVTYFLTPEGIDGTLAFIAEHSGMDSTVIFDYIYNEILHDTTQGYGKMLARAGKMSGEPYVFGIDKGQVGHFLAQRGFCEVIDMPLENLKSNYFTGPNAGRAIDTGHIAIASAKVCRAKS